LEQCIIDKSFQRYQLKSAKNNAKIDAGKRAKRVIFKV